VCVLIFVYLFVIYVFIFLCTCVCTCPCVRVRMRVCMRVFMRVCVRVRVHVCTRVFVFVFACIRQSAIFVFVLPFLCHFCFCEKWHSAECKQMAIFVFVLFLCLLAFGRVPFFGTSLAEGVAAVAPGLP